MPSVVFFELRCRLSHSPLQAKSCRLDEQLLDTGSACEVFRDTELWHDFVTQLSDDRVNSLWRIGFSHVGAEIVCSPWQTPQTNSVDAVEPCSRPLLFQQSKCVHGWVASRGNVGSGFLDRHLRQVKLARDDLNRFEPPAGLSLNPLIYIPTNSSLHQCQHPSQKKL